jgi:hypothetical protein
MAGAIEVAGDVASAASAVAGLTLVFMGSIATSFEAYAKTEQKTVRGSYQRRAWFAFAGFVLALLSTAVALISKWQDVSYFAVAAIFILFVALSLVLIAGLIAILEIK